MKKTLISLIWCGFFFFIPHIVQAADDHQPLMQKQIEALGIDEVQQYWNEIVTKYGGFLPESQKGSLVQFLQGQKEWSMKEWLLALLKFLMYELQMNGKLLGTLILLTVFSMFLQSLQTAFEQQAVSKVAYAVVYMVLIIIALNSFRLAMEYAHEAIQTMTHFMVAMVPLLLALLASSGGLISAAFFHPIILFLMNTTGVVVQYVTLPLLFLAALLGIVSTMSEHYKVTQLADLLTKVAVGTLGAILTVFLGVMSVKGTTSAVADGIALRTTKFVTGNFVPVVGKMFTDAADTVVTASMLLKNAVGIVGVALLLMIVIFPALKIFVIAFIYKLSAAVLQPLGGGAIISCLNVISKSITYVFAALAIVSLMFFLSLTVIITAGNIAMMVR
ncbi:stage III sporulation protein AE [Anoxybacteroides rupiense]|uniref:Stage III sporulation protein AE n=1 Tax=Anoxybacteroides rupiense TaxID=311460 RepID=A0ABD5ITP8_9BACL|nr:stage III sporulation protein AE [Anoxybacillus rupiensis]MBB3906805.1 stage III sporulation protein AE [Anoxybacillus rupiensis]MED5050791.1 stage III sporulation protein AE [Anoxybacillus rupiensis]